MGLFWATQYILPHNPHFKILVYQESDDFLQIFDAVKPLILIYFLKYWHAKISKTEFVAREVVGLTIAYA